MEEVCVYRRGSFLAFFVMLGMLSLAKWALFSLWEMNDGTSVEELLSVSERSLPVSARSQPVSARSQPVSERPQKTRTSVSDRRGAVSRRQQPSLPVLHPFNPNTADSAELISLGIPSYAVRHLLRYRAKGGVIRRPADLNKIYGMDEEVCSRLVPYVRLSPDPKEQSPSIEAPIREEERWRVDLNRADTALLKTVRGIGPYTAARIVSYREVLGGFVSAAQLEEIPGVRRENIRLLAERGFADTVLVRAIDLNGASLKELQRHPYLSFRQAMAIVELRNRRRSPIGTDDLSFLEEFQTADLKRLRPYLPH